MRHIDVLTVPGMGDIHWCMLKIQALLRREQESGNPWTGINLHIWNADAKPRSRQYVELLPFINQVYDFNVDTNWNHDIWHKAVHDRDTDIQWNIEGTNPNRKFDCLFSLNGPLRYGRDIQSDILPGLQCDFNYPVSKDREGEAYGDAMAERYGRFGLLYFNNLLMYARDWLNHFSINHIADTIFDLAGMDQVDGLFLTGVSWDRPFVQEIISLLKARGVGGPWLVDLTTHTDVPRLFGLMRRAQFMVGWCAGNTIMATHLGCPTVMLWSDYFQSRKFATCWADPDKLVSGLYSPLFVEGLKPCTVAQNVCRVMEAKK